MGEEEVVLVFRVDVGNAPGIAGDFDGFFETEDVDVTVELGENGFSAGEEGVGGFGGESGGGRGDQQAECDGEVC